MGSIIIFSLLFLIMVIVAITRWVGMALKMSVFLILLAMFMLMFCIPSNAQEYTPEDVVKIGMLVQHEAAYESELGKRYVIDTVLNRVESPSFPNTVKDVLSQPGQYCDPKEYPPTDVYRLVAEEIFNRTNNRVLWYRTKRYHSYGVPIVKEGNHYFSGR